MKNRMLEIVDGDLKVFGKSICRHPERPWLFSLTDVYKALETHLRRKAIKEGKNPDTYYKSKRPGEWLKHAINEEYTTTVAKKVKTRIAKYGIYCGFQPVQSNATTISLHNYNLKLLSTKDVCCITYKGNNKLLSGTFVCQDIIVGCAGFLSDKLRAEVIDVFISVMNGYTKQVTRAVEKNDRRAKGTPTRTENKQLNDELVETCGSKGVLPMRVQQGINEGVLGMPASRYRKAFDVKEPFNDNLSETQFSTKNIALILSTCSIKATDREELKGNRPREVGVESGVKANLIMTDKLLNSYLDSRVKIEAAKILCM
jgi:KilA-N domain